jgi:serine/threonine protein kinase/Flp pilus assembly protein TadD
MAAAWARGDRVTAEELLAKYPELNSEDSIRLVYEEVCLRREAGQEVHTSEVVSRFPQWKDALEVLLGCDRLLRPLTRSVVLPAVGEHLGPFRLVSELGQGASGKTYLASEPALADRLVVLKIIPDDQEEHLSLARLQHTHIIPLFSEQTFPDRGLRALCMPYLGGTSLERVLRELREVPAGQRRGRHLLHALDRVQAQRRAHSQSDEGPYRRFLEQASYVQAVCWIVACLADALHEAHAHGLVHMDVKPSNVLVTGDGLPMLLDFHLARKPIKFGEKIPDRLGGTPGWMSPEQAAALKAVGSGQPIPELVDRRTDVYALGLLLHEALRDPDAKPGEADPRAWNYDPSLVTIGLADIIRKCLALRPSERYHDAAALADDLRRHLNDLPLRGVSNRSLTERWKKWRRRQPEALTRGTAWAFTLIALTMALTLGYAFYHQRIHEVEADLEDGQKLLLEKRLPDAIRVLNRGKNRASIVPFSDYLVALLTKQLRLAKVSQRAAELHQVADLVRFWYGVTLPGGKEAQELARKIRLIWEERDFLLHLKPDDLDVETEQEIRTDLLELAVVWAELRMQFASKTDIDEARSEVRRVLDQADVTCGPSFALDRVRRACGQPMGTVPTTPNPNSAARTAWDHYDLGRFYLRSGRIQQAATEFQRTLEIRPQDFWPNFYQGLCAYELQQFDEAMAAFRTCIALVPTATACYYNRARAADALGRTQQAFADYTRALQHDPKLAVAALNRGVLSYNAGRYGDAIADFGRALEASSSPQAVGRVYYNLSLAQLAVGDRPLALASAEKAVANGYPEATDLRDRLRRHR